MSRPKESCLHEDSVAYEHDGNLVYSCRLCHATLECAEYMRGDTEEITDPEPEGGP